VSGQLQRLQPELEIRIKQIHTTGDVLTHLPLAQIGGDGVFVMEIERALLKGEIDLAVHSLKDLPTTQPAGLRIFVVGVREDVRDILVKNGLSDLRSLVETDHSGEMRIGTSSLRRSAQIRASFPDVVILSLRGNVDTRLQKLEAGDYDGIVLAAAGLHRLGKQYQLAGRMNYLPIEVMMPAPGQGALALELRDEPDLKILIDPLRNIETQTTTLAERMFMRWLGAGCYLPVAAYGEIVDHYLVLKGLVISLDGQQQVRVEGSIPWNVETPTENIEQLGVQLAEQALAEGAAEIIKTLNESLMREYQNV
jgi:hydroxymethylbilane synthase